MRNYIFQLKPIKSRICLGSKMVLRLGGDKAVDHLFALVATRKIHESELERLRKQDWVARIV